MNKYKNTLEMLFVSKVRLKVLKYFFLNPTTPIHLRGAVREFKEEINAVRRELLRLEEVGMLTTESQGNRKYFKLQLDHPLVPELSKIVHKTYGLGSEIIMQESQLGDIQFAILTPSYTRGIHYNKEQIIDLAIIGAVNLDKLSSIVNKYEDLKGKEIHYTVLKPSEFQVRKRRRDDFILNLMIQDNIMLIGKHEDMIRS